MSSPLHKVEPDLEILVDNQTDQQSPVASDHEAAMPSPRNDPAHATVRRAANGNGMNRKRKRGALAAEPSPASGSSEKAGTPMNVDESARPADKSDVKGAGDEEGDREQQKKVAAKRNFDKVIFGRWQIKTWYFSPYPLTESDADDQLAATPRPSELVAGGLGLVHTNYVQRPTLWVCDRCFKYMSEGVSWELHIRNCGRKHPPGRKVYQRGAHIIWEVDGSKEKLYCQNLSLFGKLFIDIKTLFFDCDNFLFYILTDADSQRDHVLGFFSKEKVSYDDYNLACIVVLPPYQKMGYGMLMIEFSYELSRRAGKVGTPERPLSDLGLRSYLTYWSSTLIRFFRRLLAVLPPDASKMVTTGGVPDFAEAHLLSPSAQDQTGPRIKRRKSTKGWDGEELGPHATPRAALPDELDPLFTTLRTVETTPNADGSATAHVLVRCTLADVARATHLRVEDAAFALNECGLLERRLPETDADAEVEGVLAIAVSREMVERVARERNVKRMCMDLAHVLL